MMARRGTLATILVALMVLAGCATSTERSGESLGDRGGVEGAAPDVVLDVSYVEVYRNADHFPNIARVCVRGIAFATGSTGAGTAVGATPLIRVQEWDSFCAGKEPSGPPTVTR
jgi:hypothetical protein